MATTVDEKVSALENLLEELHPVLRRMAERYLEFFRQRKAEAVYRLSRRALLHPHICSMLSNGFSVQSVSYAKKIPAIEGYRTRHGDSSVQCLMMESGEISRDKLDIYPSEIGNGYRWPEICHALYQEFLHQCQIEDGNGKQALYWFDAVKVLAKFLGVLFGFEKLRIGGKLGNAPQHLRREFRACLQAMQILPKCIPLGIKDGFIYVLVA